MKQGSVLRQAVLSLPWGTGDNAKEELSPRARLLLWDFSRGSLAYDLMVLAVLLLLLGVPPSWWRDPMRALLP